MKTVQDSFIEALRARLNGQSEALFGSDRSESGAAWTPARVRGAGIETSVICEAAAEAVGLRPLETEASPISLDAQLVSAEFLRKIPIGFARRFKLLGLCDRQAGVLRLAAADPTNLTALQAVERATGCEVRPFYVHEDAILAAVNAAYGNTTGAVELEEITVLEKDDSGEGRIEDLLDHEGRAPVVKLINMILLEAVRLGCSDVHVQPCDDRLAVRFRVDGVLRDMYWPSPSLHGEMISRIKVMGSMDIAERRLAQDGRTSVEVGGRVVDLRISTLPGFSGPIHN